MKITDKQAKELLKELNEIPGTESLTKPLRTSALSDGRNAQIQITITTNEDDFIDENNFNHSN